MTSAPLFDDLTSGNGWLLVAGVGDLLGTEGTIGV